MISRAVLHGNYVSWTAAWPFLCVSAVCALAVPHCVGTSAGMAIEWMSAGWFVIEQSRIDRSQHLFEQFNRFSWASSNQDKVHNYYAVSP